MADLTPQAKVQPAADGRQTQFLTVITRDEATERFRRHLKLEPRAMRRCRWPMR
jgi:hypothetical protein